MNKSIIVIEGKSNKGKTSATRAFREQLEITYPKLNTLVGKFTKEEKDKKRFKKDFVEIVEINGVKIGIASEGDYPEVIEKALKLFVKEKCDIIICTCRSRGKPRDRTWDHREYEHYTLGNLWGKELSVSEDALNRLNAEMIISLIKEIMKEK
jgi:hypothetical protein